MTLGKEIRKRRIEKGMTVLDLSRAIDVSPSTVTYYEQNKRVPGYDRLEAIAKALDIHYQELLAIASNLQPGQPSPVRSDTGRDARVRRLIQAFDQLSEKAQNIAIQRIEELAMIPQYKKEDEPS